MFDLFCLPYAGGSRYSYRPFQDYIPDFVRLIPLEYPGRGMRTQEKFLYKLEEISSDMYQQIKNAIGTNDYAIYGHSMGGIVAFLVIRKLLESGCKPPAHLFVTGTEGPGVSLENKLKRHLMTKTDFINEIRQLNGSPKEILENEAALEYLEPILRADFTATENYVYEKSRPINIPITVITGMQEKMTEEDLRLWSNETDFTVEYKSLPGDHFFIFNYPKVIVQMIVKKLLKK